MLDKLKAFFTNILVINLAIMAVLSLVGIWSISAYLDSYTMHGESITVPDFKGMSIEEVEETCKKRELNFKIKDTVFVTYHPKSTIVEQQPEADSKVKKERTIYLSINMDQAPLVVLDKKFLDMPLRQATSQLHSLGLVVSDEVEYVTNPARDWVQGIKYKNKEMAWGDKVPKGSTIMLILGNGLVEGQVNYPQMVGLNFSQSKALISLHRLTYGGEKFMDGSDTDKESAIVYKQEPAWEPNKQLNPNEPIFIYLTDKSVYESTYKNQD